MNAEQMWNEYCERTGVTGTYQAWAFGGAPDKLAELVLEGTKTATASAYDLYEDMNEPLPKVGDYSVILNSAGEAVCIVRTYRLYVMPFRKVGVRQAYLEGEGDRSLDYWREVHEEFFNSEYAETDRNFSMDMPVLCEEFDLVYGGGVCKAPWPLFEVRHMSEEDAEQVIQWEYPEEYQDYNFPSWRECIEQNYALTDAERRVESYRSVFLNGELIGFYNLIDKLERVELGLGLKPEYCGKGLGKSFVRAGINTIDQAHPGKPLFLYVKASNIRAKKCYLSAGFHIVSDKDEVLWMEL